MARTRAAAPLIGLLSLVAVGALALLEHPRAASHDALRTLGFGWPADWLVQDQTQVDPPSYPRQMSFISPWEHPATVHALALLLDLAVALVVLTALWLLLREGGARAARLRR